MCNSSSSVLVLNRTSPSLLHTFVAYTTHLSISIQHTGNSFLHQHIPHKRLRASSSLNYFLIIRRCGISLHVLIMSFKVFLRLYKYVYIIFKKKVAPLI